ncbi:MAG: chemotaxis protein CheW [Desulfobacteraceae bacterium]
MEDAIAKVAPNTDSAEDLLQMVGFGVAEELFGVDILMVQEIIKDITITPIPDSPDFIEGVVNLRGNIIPIIDLRKRLKLSEKKSVEQEAVWIIILNIGDRVTGFVVDFVTRVVKVPANSIKPAPDMVVSGLKSDYIRGVCKQENKLMAILDFNKILLVDEFKKVSAMRKQKAITQ